MASNNQGMDRAFYASRAREHASDFILLLQSCLAALASRPDSATLRAAIEQDLVTCRTFHAAALYLDAHRWGS